MWLSVLSVKRLWCFKIFCLSNNQTLEEITRLQKIFTKNPNLYVLDFQGLIAEDGQFLINVGNVVECFVGKALVVF
jgi:hypothetical protein